MEITLRDGSLKRSFYFEPKRHKWGWQNAEFLIGYVTGLSHPFEKVFIKRDPKKPEAHDLLVKIVGQGVSGMPKVFGHARDGQKYIYVFEHLPYSLLENQIVDLHVVCAETVRAVVNQSANTFKYLSNHGYVYIDFCAKNIMFDRASGRVSLIDVDSSWPIELLKTKLPDNKGGVEFWGLWKENITKVWPVRLENSAKTVILSFAAVWSRAIVFVGRPT